MKTLCPSFLFGLCLFLPLNSYAVPLNIALTGSGTVAADAKGDCQASWDGCTVTMTGTLAGESLDSSAFASTLTTAGTPAAADPATLADPPMDPATREGDVENDGNDSDCSSAQGELLITTADGSTITAFQNGSMCIIASAEEAASPRVFNGSFYVTRGTSLLQGASAMGRITSSIDGDNNVLIMLDGLLP